MQKNLFLSANALSALTMQGIVKSSGYCAGFVHQVFALTYGTKYILPPNTDAHLTCRLWRPRATVNIMNPKPEQLCEGDVVYKWQENGNHGHVGIYVGNGLIAENSSYHWKIWRRDARGVRALKQFGHIDELQRFPLPESGAFKKKTPLN